MQNPVELIRRHWSEAKKLRDQNAKFCTLATLSEAGEVALRTLVLRQITDDSLVIYINDTSPKWAHLQATERFELLLFWPSLMQQYRIRGELLLIPDDVMQGHWENKPYASRILDHYYREQQSQSTVVDSRERLRADVESLTQAYASEAEVPFCNNARGLAIKADYIETWQGSDDQWQDAIDASLHQRHLYRLSEGQWSRQVLVP